MKQTINTNRNFDKFGQVASPPFAIANISKKAFKTRELLQKLTDRTITFI